MSDGTAAAAASLEAKTGKSLEQWVALARAGGPRKHGQILASLKAEHGLSHGYANLVALKALGSDAGSSAKEDLYAAMSPGPRWPCGRLRPHRRAGAGLRRRCRTCAQEGLRQPQRKKQFALAQPSTKDRFDLGVNLKGVEPAGGWRPRARSTPWSRTACDSPARRVSDEDADWLRRALRPAGDRARGPGEIQLQVGVDALGDQTW